MIFAALILIAINVVVVWIVQGAASGRIGINGFAGIRVPSVIASDEAWRVGHIAALPAIALGAGISLVLAVSGAIAVGGTDRANAHGAVLAGGAGVLVLGLIVGALLANRAATATLGDHFSS